MTRSPARNIDREAPKSPISAQKGQKVDILYGNRKPRRKRGFSSQKVAESGSQRAQKAAERQALGADPGAAADAQLRLLRCVEVSGIEFD